MTPDGESGVYERVTTAPAAMLPASVACEAATVPVPRDRVAEWKALYLRNREAKRVFHETDAALARLTPELTGEDGAAILRWKLQQG